MTKKVRNCLLYASIGMAGFIAGYNLNKTTSTSLNYRDITKDGIEDLVIRDNSLNKPLILIGRKDGTYRTAEGIDREFKEKEKNLKFLNKMIAEDNLIREREREIYSRMQAIEKELKIMQENEKKLNKE